MTAVFTDFFRTQLFNSLDKVAPLDPNANLMAGKSVHWVYFRTHAAFTGPSDSRYTGIKTISELANKPGWSPPLSPQSGTQVVGCSTAADTTYAVANNKFANGGGWSTSTVTAAALVLEGSHGGTTDPIIYLTDTPFEGGVVMHQDDALIARPVPALGGNRSLFAWPVWFTGATTVQPVEGSVAVLMAPPTFEASYTQHAWLFPQRVNMIANPSFDTLAGGNHWRSSGTFTKTLGTTALPVAPGSGPGNTYYGRFTGTAPLVVESNLFPLAHSASVRDLWTIQAMIRGTGKVRVGLVGWEEDFATTSADWGGDEIWDIPPSGWLHLYALRHADENIWALVRIECDGGEMHLDNILCEPDWLTDWPYFDGDSTYGARDDYSWYGGENRKGQTYSCWYNHRRAVVGRLFAWDIPSDDFTITDEEVEQQGFVYKWIPAGVRVTPHLDVLYPNDIQEIVPNNTGTPVTPIDTGTNGGVPNAWAPFQYLDPVVGIATTPDPGPPPAEFTVVYKADTATPTSATPNTVMSQVTPSSYTVYHHNGSIAVWGSSDGTTPVYVGLHSPTSWAHPFEYAVSWRDVGANFNLRVWRRDPTGWVPVTAGDQPIPVATLFDSNAVMRIGEVGSSFDRIYSVELRTGLDPAAGTVLWRFDAAEAPGTGTTYTDPRGRVWTLSNAAAIKRAYT